MSREKVILSIVALGFLVLGLEVRVMHREVLAEYAQAYMPLIYVFLGVPGCFLAMSAKEGPRVLGGIILALGVVLGIFGFINHLGGDASRLAPLVSSRAPVQDSPPPLSPLAFSALAGIGLATLMPTRKGGE